MSLFNLTDEKSARALIEAGADVNKKSMYDTTPIHYQTDEGVVRVLIEAGADVNARNTYGNTPLHFLKDDKVIRLLIEAGADVNARNGWGGTPFNNYYSIRRMVEIIASERITRFIRNCKWFRLHKLTKTFAFNKWYCGEEDGNGGGTGRKVDHKRIMDTVGGRMK